MQDFNESKNSYRKSIENSVGFSGQNHDFFIKTKANYLKTIAKKFLPNIKKPRILDIGCGHGFLHSYFEKKDFEVVGVEIAAEVLELARESNPHVCYISHSGNTLPFRTESFDIAIAICVMHHVPPAEWQAFLLEMKRIVKIGGIAVVFEHNPYNPLTRYVVANNELDKGVTLLRSPVLKKLILKSGFETVRSRFILFTPFSNVLFQWIDKILGWCPFGAQYYIVATR